MHYIDIQLKENVNVINWALIIHLFNPSHIKSSV